LTTQWVVEIAFAPRSAPWQRDSTVWLRAGSYWAWALRLARSTARARGEMRSLYRGVYLVGPVVTRHTLEIAAVLACGPRAVLSHRSAAYLYAILPYPAQFEGFDVTIAGGRHAGQHPGIHLHRTVTLRPYEVRTRSRIPLTAVPRTLIDLGGCCESAELEAAVAEAFALRMTNRSQLLRAVDRERGRRGVAALRAQLDGERAPARTRSQPERTLLESIREAELPEPEANAPAGRWTVDLLWPEQGLAVEIDGYAAHSSRWAFERDRRKTAELQDLGLTVCRFTAVQVRDELQQTLARIERFLELLGRRAS
jgi:very-short-patch-repair endonuclease